MLLTTRTLLIALLIVTLQLAGCNRGIEAGEEESSPAAVEHFESGPIASRIVLTEDAVQRLDVQTVAVQDATGVPGAMMIPYAAVLYDVDGATWTYTNPEPFTYERTAISVEDVKDDMAIVSEGLSADASIVTVGAAELFGSESEFEEE